MIKCKRFKNMLLSVPLFFAVFVTGGCDIGDDIGIKQGFYGAVYKLTGAMTCTNENLSQYNFSQSSETVPFPYVTIVAENLIGGRSEASESNGIGNYKISVSPVIFPAYYFYGKCYENYGRNNKVEYMAFVKEDNNTYFAAGPPNISDAGKIPFPANATTYYKGLDIYLIKTSSVDCSN